MKKLFYCSILFFCAGTTANAQTTYQDLIQKINSAPPNEFNVKRIDYGDWKSNADTQKIWAIYDPDLKLYVLCVLVTGQTTFKELVNFNGKDDDPKKELVEKIISTLDPKQWRERNW